MISPTALRFALLLAMVPAATFAQNPPPPAPYTPPAKASPAAPDAPAGAAPVPAPTAPEAAPAPVPASGDAAEIARTLATEIEDVQVAGPWSDGERNGVWRTVMMQVPGKEDVYRFFVQQIERKDGKQTIAATTEIKEVPSVKGAIVGYRADEPTEGDTSGLTLFFDIVPSDGEIAETYELHFSKDAPYVFGPATN